MDLVAFSSERLVIGVETPTMQKKVFQIIFSKRDGSLYLGFPYYKHSDGLLTLATIHAKQKYPSSLSLVDGGKVTSHKVKYSHHPDGRCHFSQDGKIFTTGMRIATQFEEMDGHIFTVQFQGLQDFQILTPEECRQTQPAKKTVLNFNFKPQEPEAIKILAHCYRRSRLLATLNGYDGKPWVRTIKPDGSESIGFLILNPYYHSPDPMYLILSCEAIPKIDTTNQSLLTLLAGFDPNRISLDHNLDSRLLVMSYPISGDKNDLINQIGSIDFQMKPDA